jgi:hypothetical protein
MDDPLKIGTLRQLFWDDYLIDKTKTTANLHLHHMQKKECVLLHEEPWEGDACIYHNIVKDEDLYRMYYLARKSLGQCTTVICYAESSDGIHWNKPDLGICFFHDMVENNIILDEETDIFDNFFVFKDENPACPLTEKYKGVAASLKGVTRTEDSSLWCYTSEDALHFKRAWKMTDNGKFDTLNTAVWDKNSGKYLCFVRDFHNVIGTDLNSGIRDIRWMESCDFKNWSVPVLIDFNGHPVYPLYTNVISDYYRAEQIFVGFPTRYVERKKWTENFDQLCGASKRKMNMEKTGARSGLALTDCIFMTSHDGKSWNRFDEAFISPGIERRDNWVYGDCYPALGMIETKSDESDAPNEISMYMKEGHRSNKPARLFRYCIRIDGFASYRADYEPKAIVTKPFIFEGNRLELNFSTSALGNLFIRLLDVDYKPIAGYESCEIFGDTLSRTVCFENGYDVSTLSGKVIRMEIALRDADIYSFLFQSVNQ